jgi:hypothetical protein
VPVQEEWRIYQLFSQVWDKVSLSFCLIYLKAFNFINWFLGKHNLSSFKEFLGCSVPKVRHFTDVDKWNEDRSDPTDLEENDPYFGKQGSLGSQKKEKAYNGYHCYWDHEKKVISGFEATGDFFLPQSNEFIGTL